MVAEAAARTCEAQHASGAAPAYCEGRAVYRCCVAVLSGVKPFRLCGACARVAEDNGALQRAVRL